MTTVTVADEVIELTVVAEQGPPGVDADHSGLLNLDADDHPQYHTDARGDARYSALAHNHSGVYEANGAVSAHAGGTGVHAIAGVTGLQDALDAKSATSHDHSATYAPLAKGVTNGDAHDHSGGDGGKIAYAALSGLPTLGTAAAQNTGAFESYGSVSTHAALTTTHGISNFGATLVDDADAGTARSTLGLGTAATTASTAYATAAQGTLAATALQPGAVASETHAATSKPTPVDADELPLADSAASWGLKKLTWGNLKTAIKTAVATLTAPFSITGTAATDLPTYGSELLTSAGWTVGAGWTESPDDVFAHTSGGGTETLTHSATITATYKYQISWTVTNRTTGSFTVSVGGRSLASITATGSLGPTATDTSAFTITPTDIFDGTISLVSLKIITAGSTNLFSLADSGGTVRFEARTGNASANSFIGFGAGSYNTTGINNTANGYQSLSANTTGINNTANGYQSLFANSTGSNNTANGYRTLNANTGGNNTANGCQSLFANTTGSNNAANGYQSLFANTTGSNNAANGYQSLSANSTGSNNTANGYRTLNANTGSNNSAFGYTAGDNITTGSQNLILGYNVDAPSATANGQVNIQNIIFATGATGTGTTIAGLAGVGTNAPAARWHSLSTTEQLRLGYDATKYASFTVGSAGTLTIATSNNKIVLGTSRTPASATDTGSAGEVCWDADYLYVAVAANTWKRAALSTW